MREDRGVSAESVRIHGYPVSTFTRTARMVCVEKGIAYELVPVPYGSDEHRALHPFARIPVLEHGDTVVFETFAIADYLDAVFPGPALQPQEQALRTEMLEWIGICNDYVYRPVVRGIPRDREPTGEELGAARAVLDAVEARIRAPFLAGDALSLADLFLAPQIANAREKAPDLIASLPAITEWLARMEKRESFVQTASDAGAP